MSRCVLLLLLASPALADPPFFVRGTATNQSIGGLNGNALDQTTINRNLLTQTITPPFCPAGQPLTGAYYNNGYTAGGVCSAVALLNSTQTFTGGNTFSGTSTFNGVASFSTATYIQNAWMRGNGVGIDTTSVGGFTAWSVDGVAQSSGCVVAVSYSTTLNQMVATSTTTDFTGLTGAISAVTYEGCAPNSYCKYITRGLVHIPVTGNPDNTHAVTTSTTRCASTNNAKTTAGAACANNTCTGDYLTNQSGGFVFAWMRGP